MHVVIKGQRLLITNPELYQRLLDAQQGISLRRMDEALEQILLEEGIEVQDIPKGTEVFWEEPVAGSGQALSYNRRTRKLAVECAQNGRVYELAYITSMAARPA